MDKPVWRNRTIQNIHAVSDLPGRNGDISVQENAPLCYNHLNLGSAISRIKPSRETVVRRVKPRTRFPLDVNMNEPLRP